MFMLLVVSILIQTSQIIIYTYMGQFSGIEIIKYICSEIKDTK